MSLFVIDRPYKMVALSMEAELRNVGESLLSNVAKHRFLRVPHWLIGYVDHPHLFGEAVAVAFPSAAPDLREAGNCLSADCNTAAVFHLMRVAEWGLRALACDLGLLATAKSRKSGMVTYVPLAYSEWEPILNQLPDKVDEKLVPLPKGPEKHELQEFYTAALQDIRGIRDGWRNHVMHARREYTALEALGILEHVRRLMVTLATRVTEV